MTLGFLTLSSIRYVLFSASCPRNDPFHCCKATRGLKLSHNSRTPENNFTNFTSIVYGREWHQRRWRSYPLSLAGVQSRRMASQKGWVVWPSFDSSTRFLQYFPFPLFFFPSLVLFRKKREITWASMPHSWSACPVRAWSSLSVPADVEMHLVVAS